MHTKYASLKIHAIDNSKLILTQLNEAVKHLTSPLLLSPYFLSLSHMNKHIFRGVVYIACRYIVITATIYSVLYRMGVC